MKTWFFVVAVVLALASGAWALSERHRSTRHRVAAQRVAAELRALDACLVGAGHPLRDVAALGAHARRVALAMATPDDWPRRCAVHARALAAAPSLAPRPVEALRALATSARALNAALEDERRSALAGPFRRGEASLRVEWAGPFVALRDRVAVFARAYGASPAGAAVEHAVAALPSLRGDAIPVSIAPGSMLAGSSYAAGTLSVLFIDPSLDRVLCRTRDRGASMRCKRFAHGSEDAPEAAPRYLIGHDAPEPLVISDRPGPAVISSSDAFATALFTPPLPLVSSLPARVASNVLYAVGDDAGAAVFLRCARRGGCTRWPAGVSAQREAAMLSLGGARPSVWWVGVSEAPSRGLSLTARALPLEDSAQPGAPVALAAVRDAATLMATCHTSDAAYAVAVDGGRAHLVAVEGDAAPRLLATARSADLPFELLCDARGVTLAGATTLQSCGRDGACTERATLDGVHRAARFGGDLVLATTARDGGDGVRVRRGAPERIMNAPIAAVADDAAHGGVSARALWLFAAGDRLVMFASTSDVTTVLYSDDATRWTPTREAIEDVARPARMGSFR